MEFTFNHNNINVFDLQKSIDFYKDALGLVETKRKEAQDGSFTLVFLGDSKTHHKIELTWLRDRTTPYNLGDNESHLAFTTDDYKKAHDHHEKMGCICFENKEMGLYFINDPDGYWIEILPEKR
ncbi:VOC family protein [Inediibacterium massiliense]|uniref:VOC family protein n=1 Tax=Inediibacterium massiliense TaxID=1658111 RepID=UPI0006B573CF|nr:VOC family protein [Inediibacterium massiliense]